MTLRRLILTSISIFAFVAVSVAAALIDDQFADSNSQNHDLANNSLRIFNGRSATIRTDEVGAVTLDVSAMGTSSEAAWAFFTEAGSPVNLGVGDKLSVSLNFSMSGFTANGSDIRFGVLDSLGTRNTTNLTGGMNNSTFINDPGYALQFYPSGSGSPFGLYRRTILTGANVFNTMGDFTLITGSASGATTRQTLADSVPYTLTYIISRESSTDTRITAEVTGGALSALKYTAVESSDAPQTSFDYFGFRFGGTNLASMIKFTRVLIDYTPAIPVITLQPEPENLLVQVGGEVSYVVTAEGRQLSYQWMKNGAPFTGNSTATSSTLTLSNLQLTDAGSYTCVVSNSTGNVTSSAVVLYVTVDSVPPPPVITIQPGQPGNTIVVLGQPAALSVTATGDNLTYRWFKNNVLISGAVSSTLTFPNATLNDAGVYKVIVSNLSGSATSTPATLTVVSPMSISAYSPVTGAIKQSLDTQLNLTFDRAPKVGNKGAIRIYSSDGALYDTINLALSSQNKNIGGRIYNYRPIIISGNRAIITPHKQLIRNSIYYVLIDTGAITDEVGAPFVGISAVNQWAFSTRTNLTGEDQNVVVVAADNSGDFTTIQGAIDFVPTGNMERKTILVRKGVYNEIINIPSTKPFITIRGEDRNETIIQYDNNSNFNPAGTVYRAMFGVDAVDFVLENITLQNTTVKGGSQAEAFRSSGSGIILNQVNLKSYQDTLLMSGKGYVANSYIEGDVDFMWGGGSVFFENCELKALNPGYYTQIRNSQGTVGNVYVNCRLTGTDGLSGIWLSRIDPNVFPFSQVVFINCAMGRHINPLGWLLNNATTAPNVQFWEYNTTDLTGALLDVSGRAPFSRQLSAEEATQLSNPSVALTGWTPVTLTPTKSSVEITEQLGVEWSAPIGHSQNDWIGLFKVGASDDAFIVQQYTGAGSHGSLLFTVPIISGEYEFRYFNDGVTTSNVRSSSISVTGALYTLGSVPNSLNAGARVIVDWAASNRHQNRRHMAYIGLYKGGDSTSPPIAVRHLQQGHKGSVFFNLDELPELPSSYEFRLYLKERGLGDDVLAAVSNQFIVYPADQLLAFPGAEGAGAFATGGRGGDVYHVTNLNDSGEGSLRYGIQQATGPRTIVFDVSGNIMLKSRLKINKSNLTIAGQTAPGDGITVAGFGTNIGNAQNVIIRYLRFRAGDFNCPNLEDDAFWIDYSDNIMIDHVTASWSIDENFSVTDSNRVTVQWSIIANSLNNSCHSKGAHGYGSLLGFGGGKYSFHHNLYANNNSRNPRVGSDVNLDFVNNVVVNWMGNSGYSGDADEGSPKINYVGNYVIAGPSTPSNIRGRAFQGGSVNTHIYQSGNLIDSNVNGTRDGKDTVWSMLHGTYTKLDTPISVASTSIYAAKIAYQKVLESAGSSFATDSLDLNLFSDIQNDTGAIIDSQNQVGGLPELESMPAPIDSDQDGMPDMWEWKHRLNPRNPADGSMLNRSGYTNLEEYLNQLLDDSDNHTHHKHCFKRRIKLY